MCTQCTVYSQQKILFTIQHTLRWTHALITEKLIAFISNIGNESVVGFKVTNDENRRQVLHVHIMQCAASTILWTKLIGLP